MKIPKTKDRMLLGILSGGLAFIVQSAFDYASYKKNISKRSYWSTAAGVWVKSKRQAKKWNGQLLGAWMSFGLNVLNGIFMVWSLTKAGLAKWPLKGVMLGSITGAITNALLSGFANNKVAPKDSNSTLSYALTNAITGIVAAWAIVTFGDESLFNERRVIAHTSAEDASLAKPMNINESVVKESQPNTYIH
ncbi:hypothetical protein Desor_4500 [Desulfosporosinus orientis DSM 765]|uniref:Uncharacterized protein n=1 Tax=Desulfosporosinus orientis (strain ATCC 19365 / DSM 765 / NCIMB 8382 / VKM B-1628 / Singapore I) TaxID=768706 RepID=G7W9J2_DESOD|nr:hypothetical protein [Desulfosporosinus orientis]AET69909.1 hypothetical protein Desor_4500 [Desulfosporosinus orientis DSM 765]